MRRAKEAIYMEGKNMPEKKFSTGVISATIWNNQAKLKNGQPAEYKTISLQRRYKDKSDQWQSTTHLRVNDLPKAALVLNKAYEYLVLRETAGAEPDKDIPEEMIEVEDI